MAEEVSNMAFEIGEQIGAGDFSVFAQESAALINAERIHGAVFGIDDPYLRHASVEILTDLTQNFISNGPRVKELPQSSPAVCGNILLATGGLADGPTVPRAHRHRAPYQDSAPLPLPCHSTSLTPNRAVDSNSPTQRTHCRKCGHEPLQALAGE
jgi:hypothetical protein